eukprot:6181275-Pleurochrysis_carterae.AAC.2
MRRRRIYPSSPTFRTLPLPPLTRPPPPPLGADDARVRGRHLALALRRRDLALPRRQDPPLAPHLRHAAPDVAAQGRPQEAAQGAR